MNGRPSRVKIAGVAATAPNAVMASEPIRFPRVYAAIKWAIVTALVFLAIVATAFWTLILGGFAGSGFHASNPTGGAGESLVITPECAWPYGVDDHDATAVCRMFYNLTPEQRAQVLAKRK
jgi:hypothetical protein